MDLSALTPLNGGWSGETFLAEAGGERSVVRIYADPGDRGDAAAEIDAALLRLVRGLVPVPEVLEVRRPDHTIGVPGLLVTTFLPGSRGDLLLPTLPSHDLRRVGERLGGLAATLGGMPMLQSGTFADGSLRVEPWSGADDLAAYVEKRLADLDLEPREANRLVEVSVDAQALLDTVTRRCLVHGDLDLSNLLVDPDTLEITGLVDWERAYAGHPFADLGALLRFDRDPAFVDGVVGGYVARLGGDPSRTLALAHAADLYALVELACRRDTHPVSGRARERAVEIARSGDI